MNFVSPTNAEELFGDAFFGAAAIEQAFGASIPEPLPPIPFSADVLQEAAAQGWMLVYRTPTLAGVPFTIAAASERFPELFDARFLRQVGYQLKDEWGILLEPLAHTETPRAGWALVTKRVLPATRNRSYHEQTQILERWSEPWRKQGLVASRRLAVEAVYDCILAFRSRGERLLEREWDWSASSTLDGGYLNVGGFTPQGLQIFSYSAAVRHGALGICPQLTVAA